MSRTVDHNRRRLEVIAATRRIIVRDGIEAATTRTIAREAGYSNGVLTHYFADKDDILLSALHQTHERSRERRQHRMRSESSPLAILRELLLDTLPLDDERDVESRLKVNFLSRGLAAAPLAGAQRAERAHLRDTVRRLLGEARTAGEITTSDDLDDVADRLLALTDGLTLHRLLRPDHLSPEDMQRLVLTELDKLT